MRNIVQPPPLSHCNFCHGELRLKAIEQGGAHIELDIEIFICQKCGREQAHVVSHDHYAGHISGKMSPAQTS